MDVYRHLLTVVYREHSVPTHPCSVQSARSNIRARDNVNLSKPVRVPLANLQRYCHLPVDIDALYAVLVQEHGDEVWGAGLVGEDHDGPLQVLVGFDELEEL